MIVMSFRTQLVHWLREHGLNLKLAVSAAWLYSLQPELLPDLPQVHLKNVQGGFFNWSALKMTKYKEKFKYLNWSAVPPEKF